MQRWNAALAADCSPADPGADVPEGDTIAWAANRIRPLLVGRVPDEIRTPHPRHGLDRWPERLSGRTVTSVDTHGKHLFLRFEGDLVIHSHLGMSGKWGVYLDGRRWTRSASRAWLVLSVSGSSVVQFDGPLLELMTEGRTRFDQRLAALGSRRAGARVRLRAVSRSAARRRPDAPDRRRAPRPAQHRGDRQHLEGRGVLGGGDRSVAEGGIRDRRRGDVDRRCDPSSDDALGDARAADDRSPRVQANRPAVSALSAHGFSP